MFVIEDSQKTVTFTYKGQPTRKVPYSEVNEINIGMEIIDRKNKIYRISYGAIELFKIKIDDDFDHFQFDKDYLDKVIENNAQEKVFELEKLFIKKKKSVALDEYIKNSIINVNCFASDMSEWVIKLDDTEYRRFKSSSRFFNVYIVHQPDVNCFIINFYDDNAEHVAKITITSGLPVSIPDIVRHKINLHFARKHGENIIDIRKVLEKFQALATGS